MKINVSTTPTFDKQFKRYKKKFRSLDEDFRSFVSGLETTTGIDLGGGFFKYRLAVKSKNKGKSGGFRAISFEVVVSETNKNITFLTLFDKSESDSIPMSIIQTILDQEGAR